MADSPKDKIKYGILKAIDLSGFKVLDPPVRLLFGEEPQKQVREIAKYMLLPTLFILVCILIWNVVGPNNKTKSGEVPTPGKVLTAWTDANRFHERENEKEQAFELEGQKRLDEIKEVEAALVGLEKEAAQLQEESKKVATEAQATLDAAILPLQTEHDQLKDKFKAAQTQRKTALQELADKVAQKESSTESIIAAVKKDRVQTQLEKDKLKVAKTKIDDLRENPPKEIKEAQLAANKVADEVQHYKKRLDYLTKGNRSVKQANLEEKAETDSSELAVAATGTEVLRKAKSVVSTQEKAVKTGEQSYPRAATIKWQTMRSIATVLVGFLISAAIAIPLGIMCGLNRIIMACLTPIISIFRPVSPVVWLLIFQIVVGAFFPDPETHPLFVFMNSSANPFGFLQTNPAMIFSACTVAMCALWPALVNTALGVSAIDKDHLNVAKVLKLGFWSRLFKIVIPSSLPLVFAGLRISLGVGWMVLIAAEALSSSDGLGKFVWDEYQNGSSQSFANIILACFVVGIIGFFLDRLMIILQRLVSFDDGSATA